MNIVLLSIRATAGGGRSRKNRNLSGQLSSFARHHVCRYVCMSWYIHDNTHPPLIIVRAYRQDLLISASEYKLPPKKSVVGAVIIYVHWLSTWQRAAMLLCLNERKFSYLHTNELLLLYSKQSNTVLIRGTTTTTVLALVVVVVATTYIKLY